MDVMPMCKDKDLQEDVIEYDALIGGKHWHKAMVLSLVVHVFVLLGVGWMFAKMAVVDEMPPEPYIELSLADDGGDSQQILGTAAPAGALVPELSQNVPTLMPSEVLTYETKPVAVQTLTSDLSVISAEVSSPAGEVAASASGSASATSGGQGTATGNSGGSGTGGGNSAGVGDGTGSGRGNSGGIMAPSIRSQVEPVYPEQARYARKEGTVVLKIQILADGGPGEVSVYRSSGWDMLDDAAVEAVQKWRFNPARERDTGRAINCYTTMPVVFRLRG